MIYHQKPLTYVGQVELKVENLERSVSFYQEIIGFKLVQKGEKTAVFTANGVTPLLSIIEPEGVIPKQNGKTGLYHFAILLPSRSHLANFFQHLRKKDFSFGASDHFVSEALYLKDPDGNGIEIYADRPSSDWTWKNDEIVMGTVPLNEEDLLSNVKFQQWTSLPAESLIGHIHLQVNDLKATEEFYTNVLGFEIVTRQYKALAISSGKYHHHIGVNTWSGEDLTKPSENSAGLNWFSLQLPSDEERLKIIDRLQRTGAPLSIDSGAYITEDPSGNTILLSLAAPQS